VLGELLAAVGWESTREARRPKHKAHPALAAIGYVLFGMVLGGVSAAVWPHRFSQSDGLALLSLVLNPIASGFVMQWYGIWRSSRGRSTTNLATFLGGAAFGFGVSLARYLVIVLW
jgi:hypothetical protein